MNVKEKRISYVYFVLIQLYLIFQLFFSLEISEKTNIHEFQKFNITFGNGILHKYFLELEMYRNTYSDFIDNEHKPQRLFQSLNMDMKKNLIVIFLYSSLFFLIILVIFAMHYNVSFYSALKKQIYFIFLIILLFDVFFIKRNELIEIYLKTKSYEIFLYVFLKVY